MSTNGKQIAGVHKSLNNACCFETQMIFENNPLWNTSGQMLRNINLGFTKEKIQLAKIWTGGWNKPKKKKKKSKITVTKFYWLSY